MRRACLRLSASEGLGLVLPERRAVAAALRRAKAVPTYQAEAAKAKRAPLSLRQGPQSWPRNLQSEFAEGYRKELEAIGEEEERKAEEDRQAQWASIVRSLVGTWKDSTTGRLHEVAQAGEELKVRAVEGAEPPASLWLRNGIVVRGKRLELDMASLGSETLRWHRWPNGRLQEEWHWVHLEQGPFGQLWQKLPFQQLTPAKGPQKRSAEVHLKLGQLVLHEAKRHYLKQLCFLPQHKRLWKEVLESAESAVRSTDLVAAVAELASYEDLVDEGNVNVVASAESFWRRSGLALADANRLLLSSPLRQERVLWMWRPRGDTEVERSRELGRFMNRSAVKEGSRERLPERIPEHKKEEVQKRAVQLVLARVSKAQVVRWWQLRNFFLVRSRLAQAAPAAVSSSGEKGTEVQHCKGPG
ncbi:unnamed protein product [Effrenium voratum]|nr:unnamed protein product [Effrenium voratum]